MRTTEINNQFFCNIFRFADLIVGAPFFSEVGDEGRAYVFLSTEDKPKVSVIRPNNIDR